MKLPKRLSDKAAQFPECAYGATMVTLVLKDKRRIKNVLLAWGEEVIRIDNIQIEDNRDIPFNAEDIEDVRPNTL